MKPDSFHLAAGDGDEDFRQGRASSDAAPSAHTPGPWEVANATDVFTALGAACADGRQADVNDGWQIADCLNGVTFVRGEQHELSLAEQIANAHLIAAAPDLYVASQKAHDALTSAAAFFHGNPQMRLLVAEALSAVKAAIAKATSNTDSVSGSPASQGQSQVNKETP